MVVLIFSLPWVLPGRGVPRGREAAEVVVSLYPEGASQAELVLRIGKVQRGFERRGFFRIGALPVLLVQEVLIEFQHTQNPRATLESASRHLSGYGGKDKLRLNLEKVAFRFPGEQDRRLRAGCVKLGSRGDWELSEDVQFRFAGRLVRAQKAQLKVTGAEAGKLILHQRGQTILTDLFEPRLPLNTEHSNPDTP